MRELWSLSVRITCTPWLHKPIVVAALLFADNHQFYAAAHVINFTQFDLKKKQQLIILFLCRCIPEKTSDVIAYINNTSAARCGYMEWDSDLMSHRETKCQSWHFERESGYESITTEVSHAPK